MASMSRLSTSVALGICVFVFGARAHAAGGNEAAAEALFGEAKKLAAQGKYAEACPKFAESNKLDRGAGTLIHLGDCYEKNKQTASAWATYKEASSAAQALGRRDWEKLASQRATALEPKLARLTIKVDKPADKLEVSRDGATISHASWGVPIPVDVGAHVVEASAPGFKSFKTSATVSKDGENVEVSVPKLEAEPVAAPPPPPPSKITTTTPAPPDADKGTGDGQRTVGFIVGGIGVAGLAVGAITGLMAMGKSSDAKVACPNDGGCASRDAVDSSDSAKTLGLVSTIGFAAGGAALAAGAVLIFTAPSAKKTGSAPLRVVPSAGVHTAGLTVLGVF
jgi:hypothetical protein